MAKRVTGTVKWFDSGKGYGFIFPDSPEEVPGLAKGRDVYVHSSGIAPGVGGLADGKKVVFEIEQTKKGPKAVRVYTLETWERHLETEAANQARADREEEKRAAMARRLMERQRGLQLVHDVYPNHASMLLREALTAYPSTEESQLLTWWTEWDNDARGDTWDRYPIGTRRPAGGSSSRKWVLVSGVMPALPSTGGLVRVSGAVEEGNSIKKWHGRCPVIAGVGNFSLYHAVPSAERVETSEYFVSAEDAPKVLQHTRWWTLPILEMGELLEAIEKLQTARCVWEENFPNSAPGLGSPFLLWAIPPELQRNREQILDFRRDKLERAAEGGSAEAALLLKEEEDPTLAEHWERLSSCSGIWRVVEGLFWKELWKKLCEATGLAWPKAGSWWTVDSIVEETEALVWAASVGGQEVARLQVWFSSVEEDNVFYNLDTEEVTVPDDFLPGTIRWERVGTVQA